MKQIERLFPSRNSKAAIISPIIASLAFVMELTLVPLLLPEVQQDLNLTIGELSWIFNSYAASVAIGVLAGGWIGDTFSARKIFNIGVCLFAVGAIIVSFSSSYWVVIQGRIIQGIGGGLFSPLVPILLTKALPDRPGKILIIWGSITGYAAAIAPLIGGMVIGFTGWKLIFWIFAFLAAISLFFSATRPAQNPNRYNIANPDYRAFLQSRAIWLLFGYIFCCYGCITFFLFILPLRLTEAEFSIQSSGLMLAALWLAFSLVSTALRNWVDSDHVWKIVLAGPVFIALGCFLAYISTQPALLVISAMGIGAGFACSNAPSTQLVLQFAPQSLRSISASLDITFARLGGVVTVATFAKWNQGQILFGVAALLIIALVCAWLCSKQKNPVEASG